MPITLLSLATGALVIIVVFVAKRLVPRRQWTLPMQAMVDDLRWVVVVGWAVNLAAEGLDIPARAGLHLSRLVMALTCYQIWIWSSRILTHWIEKVLIRRANHDRALASALGLFSMAARGALLSVVILLALHNMGFNITALIAGLGMGGVAVALAVQNILGDIFASLTIVLDKPFVVGDTIQVGDMSGEVESIGLKTTRIRAASGEQISVPNSNLLQSRIHNMGRINRRRMLFTLAVAHDNPPPALEKLPALVKSVVEAHCPGAFERCSLIRLSETALLYETIYWLEPSAHHHDIQHAINFELFCKMREAAVAFTVIPTVRAV